MECRVRRVVELPSHDLLIGEVVETHVDSDLAIDMKKEFTKADPLVFMGTHYARVEGNLGRAFSIGGKLR
jgi:flavin reductase (DIM6/NTAB) family NADH-FMN oxidoreductase RutF